jgi:hypothetical protein
MSQPSVALIGHDPDPEKYNKHLTSPFHIMLSHTVTLTSSGYPTEPGDRRRQNLGPQLPVPLCPQARRPFASH